MATPIITLTLNTVTVNGDGTIYLEWSDKSFNVYGSLAEMKASFGTVTKGEVNQIIKQIIYQRFLALNPAGNNPNVVLNHAVSVDIANAGGNVITIA